MGVKIHFYNTRAEWLEARKNYIGGSDAGAILGLNPYMSNTELWGLKTGLKEPEDISGKPQVAYGTKAEHLLRELFAMDYPELEVGYKENNLFTNSEYPYAHASLDGWLRDQDGRRGVWECKTSLIATAGMAYKWKGGKIPETYYVQVIHQLLVTGFDFVKLKAQLMYKRPGEEAYIQTKHYHIERADVIGDMEYLAKQEEQFWEQVKTGKRPPLLLPKI